MHKKTNQQKRYYFSDRLKRQLSQIPYYPLTIVEASSGFGKTTAVREYLKKNLPTGACEYWYTCLGEPASMAWIGICEMLANVNGEKAGNLKNLGMPTIDMLLYLTGILRDFYCQTEAYLVIDNYQLVKCDIPRELMSAFSMHGSPNLHIIFITQQLAAKQKISFHNANIHTIDASSLFFDREDTASLFRMEGIRLSDDELESVFMSTGGWISAIRLQITNFKENGSFYYTAGIERLVETAIWKRLTPEEKDFLLSVSIMDSFTASQGAIMMGKEILPDNIEDLLKSNDFIRYFPDKGIYTMHSILQDYLRNRFYYYQSEDFQKRTLYHAGQSFVSAAQYYPAAQLFFKIRDFDAILSIPFDGEYLNNQKEDLIPEFLAAIVDECPEEILCKYPFVMLMFSYPLLLDRQIEDFQKLCRLIGLSIEKNQAELSQEELRKLKGEFTLLMSFTAYNDIRKMSEGRKAALKILDEPSSIIVNNMPWTFGNTSILNMFWRESGKLEDALRDMDECLPYYLKLTRGHGTGADSAMRAEAMLMRGEDDDAEILCYKALYGAGSHRQTSICICAELVIAHIAILRGDAEAYFTSVKNIQGYSKGNTNLYILRMVDLCLAAISLMLGSTDNVAKWLRNTESIKKTLYTPAIPYAQSLYSKLLIIEKRYNELYGISQHIINMARNTSGNVRYMLPQVYQLIYLAVAKRNNGKALEAQEYLKKAIALALPDQIYLPFAQQAGMADFLAEVYAGAPTHCITDLIVLCRRQERGVSAIRKAILQAKSPLTPREREIAQIAKDRLSSKEIADKLYISEATVRTTLKSVYSKLDIHSKIELNFREF